MTAFLIDQQLPEALATFLDVRGHQSRHIKDYPGGTTMPDRVIAGLADAEQRFVVTKDDDFRVAHLLGSPPRRLLHVTCGNITTRDLLALFEQHWATLEDALASCAYVEVNRRGVVIHDLT